MLLRWIVNQYLREAGAGKVREVVTGLARTTVSGVLAPEAQQSAPADRSSDARNATEGVPYSARQEPRPSESGEAEFLPCDVVFVFALGIESGGLVDLLKG